MKKNDPQDLQEGRITVVQKAGIVAQFGATVEARLNMDVGTEANRSDSNIRVVGLLAQPGSNVMVLKPNKTAEELVTDLYLNYRKRLANQPELVKSLEYYIPVDGSFEILSSDKEKQKEQRKPLHEAYVLPFLTDDKRPFLLLLGESGGGKSTYALKLEQSCWDDYHSKKVINRIPVLFECKSLLKGGVHKQSLYEEIRSTYGLTEREMVSLREIPLLFIFDGYDEKQAGNINIVDMFDLKKWNAKVLVTCRTQYIQENRNYKALFPENAYGGSTELYLYPFSCTQVDECIARSAKEWNITRDLYPELYELIENPLLLQMVVEALPAIQKSSDEFKKRSVYKHDRVMHLQKFTRADIYRAFIQSWNERAKERLLIITGRLEVKLWNYPYKFLTQEAFGVFCENLAITMYTDNQNTDQMLTEVEFKYPSFVTNRRRHLNDDNNHWVKFFTTEDEIISSVRQGCPIRYNNNKYSFYHKSFLEYYIALSIFNELLDDESLEESDYQINERLSNHPINKKLIVNNKAIVEFLAEMLQGNARRIERLLMVVKASRLNVFVPPVAIASANAITILNAAHFNFYGLDLSRIDISNADLRGAYCDSTKFTNAILNGVRFQNVWLNGADLSNAHMIGAQLGVALIECIDEVKSYDISQNFNRLAAICNGKVYLYNELMDNSSEYIEYPIGNDVVSVRFNLDGNRMAVLSSVGGGNAKIEVFDCFSTVPKQGFPIENPSKILAFSKDSSILANVTKDNKILLLYLADNKFKFLDGPCEQILSLCFNYSNNLLAAGCLDNTIIIWDLINVVLEPKRLVVPDKGEVKDLFARVSSVDFHPTQDLLIASGVFGVITLWDATLGSLIRSLCPDVSIYEYPDYQSVCFDKTGDLVAACAGPGNVTVWKVSTGQVIQTQIAVNCDRVHFNQNVFLASGSLGKLIHLNLVDKSNNGAVPLGGSSKFQVNMKKNKIVRFDGYENIIEYDINFNKLDEVKLKWNGNSELTFLGFGQCRDFIYFYDEQKSSIIVFALNSGEQVNFIPIKRSDKKFLRTIALSNHEDLVAYGFSDGGCEIYSLGSDSSLCFVYDKNKKTENIMSLEFSKDDSLLIIMYESGAVDLWEIKTNKIINITIEPDNPVIVVNERNNFYITLYSNTIFIWDMSSGKCFKKIHMDECEIELPTCVCLLDNKTILYTQYPSLISYDIESDKKQVITNSLFMITRIYSIDDMSFFTTSSYGESELELISMWRKEVYGEGYTLAWCSHIPNPMLNLNNVKYQHVVGLSSKAEGLLKHGFFHVTKASNISDAKKETSGDNSDNVLFDDDHCEYSGNYGGHRPIWKSPDVQKSRASAMCPIDEEQFRIQKNYEVDVKKKSTLNDRDHDEDSFSDYVEYCTDQDELSEDIQHDPSETSPQKYF